MKKQLVKIVAYTLIASICVAPVFQFASPEISTMSIGGSDKSQEDSSTKDESSKDESSKESSEKSSKESSKESSKGSSKESSKKETSSDDSTQAYSYSKIQKTIAKYQEVNKDVIAWLTVPGTNINEPVTQSKKSNNYYLKRDWRGTNYPDIEYSNWDKRPATATYLDWRGSIGSTWFKGTSRNLVLYGHNWNNLRESELVVGNKPGYVMFAQLPSYTNKDFATKNPYIYFSSGTQEGIWKVFAVSYVELSSKFPYNSPFSKKEEFAWILNEWKDRSIFDFDTEVNSDDRILTLSTCTRQYNVGEFQRFVVVARLLRDGETVKDKVKVTVNSDAKKPSFQ